MVNLIPESDTAPFVRLDPFGDGRTVIIRRGSAMGFNYGFARGRRTLQVDGAEIAIVSSQQVMSPPPMRPGGTPMSPEAAAEYTPNNEVAYLPTMEVLIRRYPEGFSEAEVTEVVTALYRQSTSMV